MKPRGFDGSRPNTAAAIERRLEEVLGDLEGVGVYRGSGVLGFLD